MSMQIFALLLVTIGFSILAYRVFSPANKSYFDAMGKIPLDESDDQDKG